MSARLSNGFGDFEGRAWLNTAHQGALPLRAAREADEAIGWKLGPHELTTERFLGIPARLRHAVGRLLQVPPEETILANSASYGLHLVAQAYPWEAGDEVLVVASDFPSDILPWLALEEQGRIRVRRIRPAQEVVEPDELDDAISPRTRLLCTTWVHSFSGRAVDLERIGSICRARNIVFLINASQALGAMPLDVNGSLIDGVVSAGFKWLCGPYGTGLCWLRSDLRNRLRRTKAYWLVMQTQEELGDERSEVRLKSGLGAQQYDVFGTANFFNFKPFTAAIEHLLEIGIEHIQTHDQVLVSRFIDGLPDSYQLLSPRDGPFRSTLVFFSHVERAKNREVHALLERAGVDVALRNGALRMSPHLYNDSADIDRVLSVLGSIPDSR